MRWTMLWVLVVAFVLVPFFLFEDWFNAVALQVAGGTTSRRTAAALAGGLLTFDVFLPVPSSLVSAAAGVVLGFWPATALIWASMTLACLLGYGFGRSAATAARRFVGQAGITRATRLAAEYGNYAIAICRPIPVLAEASIILAGLVRAPIGRFLPVVLWSNLGIALVYAAIGAYAMRVQSFLLAFLGAILVPGLAVLASRVWFGRGGDEQL
jgi:membrane protein DedA with SNARE-associated domain